MLLVYSYYLPPLEFLDVIEKAYDCTADRQPGRVTPDTGREAPDNGHPTRQAMAREMDDRKQPAGRIGVQPPVPLQSLGTRRRPHPFQRKRGRHASGSPAHSPVPRSVVSTERPRPEAVRLLWGPVPPSLSSSERSSSWAKSSLVFPVVVP
jgi:hypothetical protein